VNFFDRFVFWLNEPRRQSTQSQWDELRNGATGSRERAEIDAIFSRQMY
jgi:hypothetical protein